MKAIAVCLVRHLVAASSPWRIFSFLPLRGKEKESGVTLSGVSCTRSGGCWEGWRGWIRLRARAVGNASLALGGVRESQCAARRASCRTSWFYPRWATMYPDTTTTIPSLTGRPPRIVNIHSNDSPCAWWVSAIFFFILVLHFISARNSMIKSFSFTFPPFSYLADTSTYMKNPILGNANRKMLPSASTQLCEYHAVMWATGIKFRVSCRNARVYIKLFLRAKVNEENRDSSSPSWKKMVSLKDDTENCAREKIIFYVLSVVSWFYVSRVWRIPLHLEFRETRKL